MASISDEIEAYASFRPMLERDHFAEWVIVYEGTLHGTYASFEAAAAEAVKEFGRGPYLIRQVGVPTPPLPASVLHGLS